MKNDLTRRSFLFESLTGVSAAWVSAHWPAIAAAADFAHRAAQSWPPAKFEFFSPEQAAEVEAIAARIIPTTDTPGAHEAGAVYFIDRAFVTFARGQQEVFRDGLPGLQALTKSLFPQYSTFSQASADEQDQVLQRFGRQDDGGPNVFAAAPATQNLFETVRWLTVAGFLADPDTRGNPAGMGWKLIGRDREHMFQPPFGYYDKDYPGWQPNPADTDKNK
jgi:gluconate 2-dehydrogenase gamma chain